MRHLNRKHIFGVALVVALTQTTVACQQEAAHDPILMYFVQDASGAVFLVIEPNDVIPPYAEFTFKMGESNVWVGGLGNADGSYTLGPFRGEVGDVVRVSATSDGAVQLEACVLIGNFGHPPEPYSDAGGVGCDLWTRCSCEGVRQ